MADSAPAIYRDLADRTVFVSGGATGIGAAIVSAFAGQGCRVHFIDVQEQQAQELVESLAPTVPAKPVFTLCDVTEDAALHAALDAAEADGGLDILVNNAANDTRHLVEAVDAAFWDTCIKVNLRHQFVASQHAFSLMQKRRRGSIVNFGSVAPTVGIKDLSVYSTAKSAVKGLTRSLAREYGEAGIRVNSVVPGAILTQRQLDLWISPEDEARILQEQCLHRRLVETDVAAMVLFLASDVSSACTSQEFVVDGGLIG